MMEANLETYDEDIYQSKEIAVLCKHLLTLGGIEYDLSEVTSELEQSHVRAYNFLRIALRGWERETELSVKALNVEPPLGGLYRLGVLTVEADKERLEVIRLNRSPEDLPDEDAVSEGDFDEEDASDEETILDGI
jgi:hypothetical protein